MKNPPEKGDTFVDTALHDLEGKPVSLSQFKGKAIMLNFWATWCPPCREEMPSMEALYRKFKGTDLVMLAVSIDDNVETIKEYIKKNNYTMPVFHDADKEAAAAYGLTGVPETFLIDRKGIVVEKFMGALDWTKPEVVKLLQDLMK